MNLICKTAMKSFPIVCSIAFACMVGCGDDSSSHGADPSDPATVESSSAGENAENPTSSSQGDSGNQGNPGEQNPEAGTETLSSASESSDPEILSSASVTVPAKFAEVKTLSVEPDTNGFYDVGDIYKAAPETYRIAFVLRHAARESGLGQESALTEAGVAQALNVGAKLAGGDESFYYASTDFVRTRETCNNIAKGRGETDFETETQAELLNGSYFLTVSSDSLDAYAKKKGGSWKVVSAYAFGEQFQVETLNLHFYDLFERGNQFVMENIVANMPKWKRVSVLVSHDVLLEPLVVYASNRQATVNFYRDGRWVNYLSGIAVVLNAEDQVEVYPVRGNDVGFMYTEARQAKIDSLAALENP
ncbi:histidine phosphatase family protein [Fibrobacter sp.]|uniref:histidine phosphatase family protein n=1 Tax=Fibrobacter sp. TaxID=35828 RepID=UPI0038708DAB